MYESCPTCTNIEDEEDLHLIRAWVLLNNGDKIAADIMVCNQCLPTIDAEPLDDGYNVLDTNRQLRAHPQP
jgi:hypothetical protein